MKKRRILFDIVLVCLGCVLAIVGMRCVDKLKNEKKEDCILEYNSRLQVEKLTPLGEKTQQEEALDNKYKVFLYIDASCESCIKSFSVVERMYTLLKEEKIAVNIIWRQKPDGGLLKSLSIPKDSQYETDGINLRNEFPLYVLTGADNRIMMMTENADKMMQKILLLDNVDKNKIVQAANTYLQNLLSESGNGKSDLIYFAMDGCSDCESAMKTLNEKKVLSGYNLLTIYTEDSYGEKELTDDGGLFRVIYGIEWYPSFLIVRNGEYEFVGQETEADLIKIFIENK